MITPGALFIDNTIKLFRTYKSLADQSLQRLNDAEFVFQPSDDANSASILVAHLAGNMHSRFSNFYIEDGEKPWRNRDAEFEWQQKSRKELTEYWEAGWAILFRLLEEMTEADLLKTVKIRNEPHTVMEAIQRQIAHYSYHIGQIVYISKWLKGSEWDSLSIPKNKSQEFNREKGI